MAPITELLEVLSRAAEENCNLDSKVSLKELSPGNSLYAEAGDASAEDTYYDKSQVLAVPVLFLCRNKSQQRALEQLEIICNYFQRLKKYPSGETFSWLDTEITKHPSKVLRDEDGMYHYSCILRCRIFY